jgi:hypothetical protein
MPSLVRPKWLVRLLVVCWVALGIALAVLIFRRGNGVPGQGCYARLLCRVPTSGGDSGRFLALDRGPQNGPRPDGAREVGARTSGGANPRYHR